MGRGRQLAVVAALAALVSACSVPGAALSPTTRPPVPVTSPTSPLTVTVPPIPSGTAQASPTPPSPAPVSTAATKASPTTGPSSTRRPPSTTPSLPSLPPTTSPPARTPTAPSSTHAAPAQPAGHTWSLAAAGSASPVSLLPGSGSRKVVALTFDDGPGPNTHQILDVLASHGVHGTFCQIGRQVGDFPDEEKRIVAEGNALCNHSWDHIYARTTSAATIPGEVDKTNDAIEAATGVRPDVMRAPGGLWTTALYSALAARHMVPLGWAVDPDDWKRPGTAAIVSRVLDQVRPGAVILMHDGGGDRSQTVAALGTIIDTLRAQGYSFVTL